MTQKRLYAIIAAAILAGSSVSAKSVSGIVRDAATGRPLNGVQVKAYGQAKYSALTNDKGEFTINDMPDFVSSLYLTLEGMAPQQVAIGGEDNTTLQTVMYSEAFTALSAASTSALHASKASAFDNQMEASIDPFISQRLGADVRTISRGAGDGLGNMMLIGGINSLNANAQPLIIVDGVVFDMKYDSQMVHDGYNNNILANINVNDIDRVEVMKNGTAIYGAKAANGVILITTKRNRSMATKIDVTLAGKYVTVPRTSELLSAEQYRTYATEMLSAKVPDMSSMKFLVADPSYYYYPQYHNNTDWKKQVYDNSFAQSYGINVQGGDAVANYNLSVGYMDANSPLKYNDFSRFDMRLNTDIEVIRNLNVRFDASFSDVNRNLRDVGVASQIESTTITSPNFLAQVKAPFLSPYAYDVNGNVSSYFAEADDYLQNTIITSDRSLANPVSILEIGEGRNRNTYGNRLVMFTIAPSYTISKRLKVSERFNFTLVNTNENYYLAIKGVPQFRVPGLSDIYYVDNMVRSLSARQNAIQSDTRIDWNNKYGAHAINVFGGVRYINNSYVANIQNGYNTGNDKTPNVSPSLAYKSTEGADDKYTDIAWYASADYNYAEKYYLTASLTAQTSSRFGKEADGLKAFGTVWGIFPGIQASYVMTNEKWMPKNIGIDYLRINAGFDVTGNDNIDYAASRSYFISKSMMGATLTGKVLGNVGNSTLKWETTNKFNAGFEANLLNNRIHLGFNYFYSKTSNLLMLQQMAWTSGMTENWGNAGSLSNTGFDVSVLGRVINTRNWHWELGASVAHYANKVTDLGRNKNGIITSMYGANVITTEGAPVAQFYGYRTNGVYSTTEQAAADARYQFDESGNKVYFQAGDMKFADLDNNNVIDKRDMTVIGDPNPDLYGNIYSHLNWKRFTLDATFTYSIGNDIYNYERSILESGKYFYNQTTAMLNRWTTEGQVTNIPRISYQDPHANARFSDRWIEDGSYLRLSNVTLSYDLPLNLTFLQGLTVWGAAYNLFTITPYLGSDPDCTASSAALLQGIDRGLLGASPSFALGVKVKL